MLSFVQVYFINLIRYMNANDFILFPCVGICKHVMKFGDR